jgi:hypothetical protein
VNEHMRFAANPFLFSFRTEIPITACLQSLENSLNASTRGVSWWNWMKTPRSVRVIVIDKEKNCFCIRVSNPGFPLMGAEALGDLQQIDGVTLVTGHIRNLAWKYLYFVPLVFTSPILIIFSMGIEKLEYRVLYLIFFVFVFAFNYIYMTLRYKTILLNSIKQKLG